MADPLRFDGQVVVVSGMASQVAERFRAAGAEVRGDVEETAGRLDVLVVRPGPPSGATGPETITRNLTEPLHLAPRAHAVMTEQDSGGAIVFVVGRAAREPSPDAPAYAAAEAGIVNLVTTLALEWRPRVRVNCVCADSEEAAADACLFLASPAAAHVNGATVVVDEGGDPPAYLAAAAG